MIKYFYLTLLLLSFSPAHSADTFTEMFTQGQANIAFRYRYEYVDQENFSRDANASTIRTRLSFLTDEYNNLSFFAELENINEVLSDNFNAGGGNTPDRTEFPTVADPNGTEFNQAWLNWNIGNNALKVGRQMMILDNQRFVGAAGWRQNGQTFDAVRFDWQLSNSRLLLAYVDQANRVLGEDVPGGRHDNASVLINWAYQINERHRFVGYHYDIENKDVAAFSTAIFGASYNTNWQWNDYRVNFGLEYATQSDQDNNPVDYTANYWSLDAGLQIGSVNVFIGHEVLTGDANREGAAFRTPLASQHGIHGWADQFINTPDAGLEDNFIGIKGKHNSLSWELAYHTYDAESGDADYGDELNAKISKQINEKYSLLLKAADYNSDSFAQDVTKLWFMVEAQF